MPVTWASWAVTDVGTVRSGNQDAFVDRPDLRVWAVADGAGGHEQGEVASAELKATLEAPLGLSGADLIAAVRARVAAVHNGLRQRAGQEQARTGQAVTIASTLVVFLADGDHFACLWCGDSRAYLLRDGAMLQLTRDHSLVQEMVDAGVLAAGDAERHPPCQRPDPRHRQRGRRAGAGQDHRPGRAGGPLPAVQRWAVQGIGRGADRAPGGGRRPGPAPDRRRPGRFGSRQRHRARAAGAAATAAGAALAAGAVRVGQGAGAARLRHDRTRLLDLSGDMPAETKSGA